MSDPDGILASPVETIFREEEDNLRHTITRIRHIMAEYQIHTVVLGLPLNMDGTQGPSAEKAQAFRRRLERDLYKASIIMVDERLSTWQAEKTMIEAGIKDRRERKKTVDQMAACLILQEYLDRQRGNL